jgi:glyoxylase-like metal-dependent hydrolase (beta-lactamase superfamily II)
MHIACVTVGPAQSNCYLLWNDERETLVIDPGGEAEQLLAAIQQRRLKVIAYPLTHGHVDHVTALAELHRAHPAPIGMHPADAAWAFSPRNALPPWYDAPEDPGPIDRAYDDGQTWTDAGFPYEVWFTPGHSPGGVSFYFPTQDALFPGDCLFQSSIGRTDIPGGHAPTLMQSLRRLLTLPDHTRVFPGHGPETTIGQERRHNPFLQRAP